jgi:transcriptional regulator with XRE-family HTH domain
MAEQIWAAAIRRHMAAQGVTGAQLARDKGIRPNTLSDALNKPNTGMKTLARIADALGVPLWSLFVDEKQYGVMSAHLEAAQAKEHEAQQAAAQDQDDAAAAARLLPKLLELIAAERKLPPAAAPVQDKKPALVKKKRSA